MYQIKNTNIHIGGIGALNEINEEDWAIVHASQRVHYKIFGWDRKYNKPPKNHPHYIIYENDRILSLNWVDGPAYLYNMTGASGIIQVLDFIGKWIQTKKILIHCDQGISRSPTLCLLYLSKRLNLLPNSSFDAARVAFKDLYSNYNPGGIGDYVAQEWNQIQ